MISLNPRSRQILGYLLDRDEPTLIRQLAEVFAISPRTVRYDLDHLRYWLKERGLGLVTRPRVGVWLAGDKRVRETLRREIGGREPRYVVLKPGERRDFLLMELLRASGPVPAEKLARRVGVSRSTVFKDLEQMEPTLQARGLIIRRKLHSGIEIMGPERARREMLVSIIIEYAGEGELAHLLQPSLFHHQRESLAGAKPDPGMSGGRTERTAETAGYLQELFGKVEVRAVEEIVDLAQGELGIIFADSSYVALVVHLVIVMERLREGKAITMPPEQLQPLKELPEFPIARRAAQRLEEKLGLEIPEAEAGYITLHLVGGKVRAKVAVSTASFSEDSGTLAACIRRMAVRAGNVLGVDLIGDRQLLDGLRLHLEPALNRLKFGLANPNPLREQIKTGYPEAFRAAQAACRELESLAGVAIDEDTVSFVAMHLGAAVERAKNRRPKRVLVVCSTGVGSARLLAARLVQEFPEIELEGVVSAREAERECQKVRPDLVISTIPLDLQGPPVIQLSPLVTGLEVSKVEEVLRGLPKDVPNFKGPCLPSGVVDDLLEIVARQAEVKDREQLREQIEKYFRERFPSRVSDGRTWRSAAASPAAGGPLEAGNNWPGHPDPVVLAATRKMVQGIQAELGLSWDEMTLMGLALHLDLARERWKRGESFAEPELDLYRSRDPRVFETVGRYLQGLAREVGAKIDENEVVPVLRYLLYQRKEAGKSEENDSGGT